MIPRHDLIPPALRKASVEEQLSYLLRKRATIDRVLKSLDNYSRLKDPLIPLKDSKSGQQGEAA